MSNLLDSHAAGVFLGLTTGEVDRLVRERRIPFVQLPAGHVRFNRDDLQAWARRNAVYPSAVDAIRVPDSTGDLCTRVPEQSDVCVR